MTIIDYTPTSEATAVEIAEHFGEPTLARDGDGRVQNIDADGEVNGDGYRFIASRNTRDNYYCTLTHEESGLTTSFSQGGATVWRARLANLEERVARWKESA